LFLITTIKTVIYLTLLILHNKTLKLSQFTLLLMVEKFVNVQGIKLLYKYHTEENFTSTHVL